MRYQLEQKLWTLGDDFRILDADGQFAFEVSGRFFSWGDSLSFRSATGEELATIEQEMITLKPRYRIRRDGKSLAEVTKERSWLKSHFELDVPGDNDYVIRGSFWEHEYTFERSGKPVATVSKDIWPLADCYGVDIIDGEDEIAILCTVVVIDLVCHDEGEF